MPGKAAIAGIGTSHRTRVGAEWGAGTLERCIGARINMMPAELVAIGRTVS
jgi:hypothetical protein